MRVLSTRKKNVETSKKLLLLHMKDFSYHGKLAARRETAINRVKAINQDFKILGIVSRLVINGTTLQIRFKLDGKIKSVCPPLCDMSASGIEHARSVAQLISQQIRIGKLSKEWIEREIRGKTEPTKPDLLISAVIDTFPALWLKYRSGDKESTDRQKKHTLDNYTYTLARLIAEAKISPTAKFDIETIRMLMDVYEEGTDKKFRAKECLSVITAMFGIKYDFKGIGKRPKSAARQLPTDDEIVSAHLKLASPKHVSAITAAYYQWVFAVLATYGLRPQEIAAIDANKSFRRDTDNWIFLDGNLCEGIKTGNRLVPPLLSDWVDLFDLSNIPQSPFTCKGDTQRRANMIADYFRSKNIGLRPYDLRHAYAIRSRRYMGLLDAANAMGHDVSTHTKIYQRWISDIDRIESVRQGMRERGH